MDAHVLFCESWMYIVTHPGANYAVVHNGLIHG